MGWFWNGNQMVNVPDNTMGAMNNMGMNPYAPQMGQMPFNGVQQQPMNGFQGQQQTPNMGQNSGSQVYTNIVRVYGIDGARNYQLPNNSDVILYDNDKDIAYRVTVDGTGKREVLPLDLFEHKDEPPVDYSGELSAIRKELDKTNESVAKLRDEFANYKPKKNLTAEN